MCGRFEIHSAREIIAQVFQLGPAAFDVIPNYNVAPGQDVAMVVHDGTQNRLRSCRWGFVPSWSKELKTGYKMINARAETVAEKPSFKKAFVNQRCLIVADGFYEWRASGQGKGKEPVYVRLRSREPFGFAGLYSVWHSPEGEDICTCTIIVTAANDLLRPVHDRMPVIMPKTDHAAWLDPGQQDPARLQQLLTPRSDAELELYDVSPKVNSARNNSPDLIRPLG